MNCHISAPSGGELRANIEGLLKKFRVTKENEKESEIFTLANLDNGCIRRFIVKKVDEAAFLASINSHSRGKEDSKSLTDENENTAVLDSDEDVGDARPLVPPAHKGDDVEKNNKHDNKRKHEVLANGDLKQSSETRKSSRFRLGCDDSDEEYSMPGEDKDDKEDPGVVNPVFFTDDDEDDDEVGRGDTSTTASNRSSPEPSPKLNFRMSPKRSPRHSPVSHRSGNLSQRSSVSSVRKGILKKSGSSSTINMEMVNLGLQQNAAAIAATHTAAANGHHRTRFTDPYDDNFVPADTHRFVSSPDEAFGMTQKSLGGHRVKFILETGKPDHVTGSYDDIRIEKMERERIERIERGKNLEVTNSAGDKGGRKCLLFCAAMLVLTGSIIVAGLYGSGRFKEITHLGSQGIEGASGLYGGDTTPRPTTSVAVYHVPDAMEVKFRIINLNFSDALINSESETFKSLAKDLESELGKGVFSSDIIYNGKADLNLKLIKFEPGSSIICTFRIAWTYFGQNQSPQDAPLNLTVVKDRLSITLKEGSFEENYRVPIDSLSVDHVIDKCKNNEYQCSNKCVFSRKTLRFQCTCPDYLYLVNTTFCADPTKKEESPSTTPAINFFGFNPLNVKQVDGSQLLSIIPEYVGPSETAVDIPPTKDADESDKDSTVPEEGDGTSKLEDGTESESSNSTVLAKPEEGISMKDNTSVSTNATSDSSDIIKETVGASDNSTEPTANVTVIVGDETDLKHNMTSQTPDGVTVNETAVINVTETNVEVHVANTTQNITTLPDETVTLNETSVTDVNTGIANITDVTTTTAEISNATSVISSTTEGLSTTVVSSTSTEGMINITTVPSESMDTNATSTTTFRNDNLTSTEVTTVSTDSATEKSPLTNETITINEGANATVGDVNVTVIDVLAPHPVANETGLPHPLLNMSAMFPEIYVSPGTRREDIAAFTNSSRSKAYVIQDLSALRPGDSPGDVRMQDVDLSFSSNVSSTEIPVSVTDNVSQVSPPQSNVTSPADTITTSKTDTNNTAIMSEGGSEESSVGETLANSTAPVVINDTRIESSTSKNEKPVVIVTAIEGVQVETEKPLLKEEEEVLRKNVVTVRSYNYDGDPNVAKKIPPPVPTSTTTTSTTTSRPPPVFTEFPKATDKPPKVSVNRTTQTVIKSSDVNIREEDTTHEEDGSAGGGDMMNQSGFVIDFGIIANASSDLGTMLGNSTVNGDNSSPVSPHDDGNNMPTTQSSPPSTATTIVSTVPATSTIATTTTATPTTVSTPTSIASTVSESQQAHGNASDSTITAIDPGKIWKFNKEEVKTTTTTPTSIVQHMPCKEDQVECVNGTSLVGRCIPRSYRCNSIPDCSDLSDEQGCAENGCYDNFQCKDDECIERQFVCDGITNCRDGDDEINCDLWECRENEFKCGGSGPSPCLPLNLRCDGQPDCPDHSDEVNCTETCARHFFRCPDGWCIPKARTCDGHPDCHGGEDEMDCGCSGLDETPCAVGGCVSTFNLCDGSRQCQDGSDEWHCVRIKNTTRQLQVRSGLNRWSSVCGEGWTYQWSDLVCEQLGSAASVSTEVRRVTENKEGPRVRLAPKASARALRPLQFVLRSACSSDNLVHLECDHHACGSWSDDLLTNGASEEVKWPSLTLLVPTHPFNDTRDIIAQSCTASVLTPLWLLAAYSCLSAKESGLDPSTWAVESSRASATTGTQYIHIAELVPYPGIVRTGGLWTGDAVLLRLYTPLVSGNIQPICVADGPPAKDAKCVVAGWTRTQFGTSSDSQFLHYLPVPALALDACNTTHYPGRLNNAHTCVGFSDAQHTPCHGDEGSPLMCLSDSGVWHLEGLLSQHARCGRAQHPAVFTALHALQPWLSNTIGMPRVTRTTPTASTTTTTTTTTTTATTMTTSSTPPTTTTTTTSTSTSPPSTVHLISGNLTDIEDSLPRVSSPGNAPLDTLMKL